MSTRATITVADSRDSFDIYQHHDGYPEGPFGLVRQLGMAQRLAWDLPRFEAADFAAAIIAVLKDRGGSTYLTADAEAHTDRAFHYRVEPLRDGVSTQVQLTIAKTTWRVDQADTEMFKGPLTNAIAKSKARESLEMRIVKNEAVAHNEKTAQRHEGLLKSMLAKNPYDLNIIKAEESVNKVILNSVKDKLAKINL